MNFIPTKELLDRRIKLFKLIEKESILICLSNSIIYRNRDVAYPFRQDSNFWYLTGLDQEDCIYLLLKTASGEVEEKLFCKEKNPKEALWTGQNLTKTEIKKITNMENILEESELMNFIDKTLPNINKVYIDKESRFDPRLKNDIMKTIETKIIFKIDDVLKKIRIKKSDWEIQQIKKAAKITTDAHINAAKMIDKQNNKTIFEYQIQAEIEKTFRENNTNWAYYPIVGNGKNACTLHYSKNNSQIDFNQPTLIDAGCEYNYYSADITRTIIPKKPSTQQKEIYDLVLKVQEATIKKIKAGTTLQQIHHKAAVEISKGLIDLQIIKKSFDETIDNKLYSKYFPHGIGHWLGLDTHDIGDYTDEIGNPIKLENGMIFTIEPGIYISDPELKNFHNIGVRIEDNVAIQNNKTNILTKNCPKYLT